MQARNNPFATDRMERLLAFRPEWLNTDWQEIEQRWQQLEQRAAIIGNHGSGKTTLLDAWTSRLQQQGQQVLRLFLNRDNNRLSASDWQVLHQCQQQIVILDGEEQLGWRARRKFYQLIRASQGVIVTRHRPGKLDTLLHLEANIDTLKRCIKVLDPENHQKFEPMLPTWWQEHHDNIREILLRCYDIA